MELQIEIAGRLSEQRFLHFLRDRSANLVSSSAEAREERLRRKAGGMNDGKERHG